MLRASAGSVDSAILNFDAIGLIVLKTFIVRGGSPTKVERERR